MKNLVVVCQTSGYLIKDIANVYVSKGWYVSLMTSTKCFNDLRDELNAEISHSPVISYNKRSAVKRVMTWLVCSIQMWIKLLLCYNKAELLVVSNPPLGPLLPMCLPNKYSILIWDVYPDVLVSQNVIAPNHFLVKWWGEKNKTVFKNAKWVYTISQGMKDCLSKYADESKIKVVPLWPNGNLFRVEEKDNRFIKEQGLKGKFVVLYSGNLGNTHRMDVLLDVAQLINDDNIEIVLVGEGGKKKMIEERIAKEKIKNVRLLPYQPKELLPHSLSSAHIAVVTLDFASSVTSVPSKTFNLMAVGAPLLCIASPDSELANIVRENKVGEIYPPDDLTEIAQYILKLKRNPDIREMYSRNSLMASKKYTSENAKLFVT